MFRRFSAFINDWYSRNMPEFWLRLKPSYQWAFGIAALVLLWVLSGQLTNAFHAQKPADTQDAQAADNAVPRVRVVMLNAQLLGIEELSDTYMASVEFSGMIREDASAGASPFREVWNMTKPRNGGSGWLVAGVQALQ